MLHQQQNVTDQHMNMANQKYPTPPPYVATTAPQGGTPLPQNYVTQTTVTTNRTSSTANSLRTAIPELPMVLACVLCVVNVILPGIGTILAGFSVLCCGNVGQKGSGRFVTFCINFWIGFAQLFLVVFFVGWIWSIMWGVAFIAISAEAHKRTQTTTTTTTVTGLHVPTQPLPQAGYPMGATPYRYQSAQPNIYTN